MSPLPLPGEFVPLERIPSTAGDSKESQPTKPLPLSDLSAGTPTEETPWWWSRFRWRRKPQQVKVKNVFVTGAMAIVLSIASVAWIGGAACMNFEYGLGFGQWIGADLALVVDIVGACLPAASSLVEGWRQKLTCWALWGFLVIAACSNSAAWRTTNVFDQTLARTQKAKEVYDSPMNKVAAQAATTGISAVLIECGSDTNPVDTKKCRKKRQDLSKNLQNLVAAVSKGSDPKATEKAIAAAANPASVGTANMLNWWRHRIWNLSPSEDLKPDDIEPVLTTVWTILPQLGGVPLWIATDLWAAVVRERARRRAGARR